MDYRHKIIIAFIVNAFILDYVIFPGLTAANTVLNVINMFNILLLAGTNYLFFTKIENK